MPRGLRCLRPVCISALALLLAGAGSVWLAPAGSAQQQGRVVSEVPASWTPDVRGEPFSQRVNAIAKVGDTIVIGGTFSQLSWNDRTYERHHIAAFSASTGKIVRDFAPKVTGRVDAIIPASSGDAVFIGGGFDSVNGETVHKLAKLDLSGQLVPRFDVPTPYDQGINGRVRDLAISGGRLYVAGDFTHVAGKQHQRLVTLNPQTGALDPYMDLQVSGTHNGGFPNVRAFDISANGNQLVAIGNFDSIDDTRRDQLAMIDLTGSSATLATDWRTTRYRGACSDSFDTYMRDVAFSPGGSYFVVVTTGGGVHSPGALCDTAVRWESDASGRDVQPTWVNYTGRDTLTRVALAGGVVYIGGHQRWLNNPHGTDDAGPGAVPRPGIGALHPGNGVPLAWNPGRIPRGYGVTSMLVTQQGLWVGSDTEFIGQYRHRRERIAFFPFSGGTTVPRATSDALPGDVHLMGGSTVGQQVLSEPGNGVAYRWYDGQSVGGAGSVPAGEIDQSEVRGAALIGDTLWYGSADGNFYRVPFDGQEFGRPVDVDPYADPESAADDPKFPTDEQRPVFPGQEPELYDKLSRVTGVFYASGRLYYTLAGQSRLYYRDFVPSSGIMGPERKVADTAPRWATVQGMFLSGGDLYYATSDGNLHRVGFSEGAPAGSGAVVENSGDWAANALFLRHSKKDGDTSPSPTPTVTETSTSSPTPTNTASPTPTATATSTSSPTPTVTATPTSSPTPTNTASPTPTDTGDSSPSPTEDGESTPPDGGGPPGDGKDDQNPGSGNGNDDTDGGTSGGGDSDGDVAGASLSSGGDNAPDDGALPYTGFELGLLLAVGLSSLAVGWACVAMAGRRQGARAHGAASKHS